MDALFVRHLGSLRPTDSHSEGVLNRIPQGGFVTVIVKRPRNIKFFRKAWILAGIIAESLDGHYDKECVMDLLKLGVHHTNRVKMKDGSIVETPRSISFAAMSEMEFGEFWNRIVAYTCSEILPNLDRDVLEREVQELLQ